MQAMKIKTLLLCLMVLAAPSLCLGDVAYQNGVENRQNPPKKINNRTVAPKLCAAVRGNGGRIFAHFGTLARAHELYGALGAMSGGSSGSLVSFLTDAIYANPLAKRCGSLPCSKQEHAARLALMYKTLGTVLGVMTATGGGDAGSVPKVLTKEFEANGIDSLILQNPAAAVELFRATLTDPKVDKLINPDMLTVVDNATDKPVMVADLLKGIRGSTDFRLDSPLVFVRPGVVSVDSIVDVYGRIGSFYAMQGQGSDRHKMALFFKKCGTPGRGKPWEEVAGLSAGRTTCGNLLLDMVNTFDEGQTAIAKTTYVDLPTATALPMLVSVSYVGGQTAQMLKTARADYLAGRSLDWNPDFADWRVLYTGRQKDLALLMENRHQYADLKSVRTMVDVGMTWREILTRSISEPGTQAAIDLESSGFTAGGWVDGQPVRALRNMGCETIMALESLPTQIYPSAIASLLGASAEETSALFSVDTAVSSHSINIAEADGVWCTDWSKGGTPVELSTLGWNAQIESRSPKLDRVHYDGLVKQRDSTLCTPPRSTK